MAQPIVIDGIDLALKADISDRDISSGEYVPERIMQRIRAEFPEHFTDIKPGARCRWSTEARFQRVTFVPDEE